MIKFKLYFDKETVESTLGRTLKADREWRALYRGMVLWGQTKPYNELQFFLLFDKILKTWIFDKIK